jgi:hypothetical protein
MDARVLIHSNLFFQDARSVFWSVRPLFWGIFHLSGLSMDEGDLRWVLDDHQWAGVGQGALLCLRRFLFWAF